MWKLFMHKRQKGSNCRSFRIIFPSQLSLLTPKYHKYYLFDISTWISCITFFACCLLCLMWFGKLSEGKYEDKMLTSNFLTWEGGFFRTMPFAFQSCHNVHSSVANVKFLNPFYFYTCQLPMLLKKTRTIWFVKKFNFMLQIPSWRLGNWSTTNWERIFIISQKMSMKQKMTTWKEINNSYQCF